MDKKYEFDGRTQQAVDDGLLKVEKNFKESDYIVKGFFLWWRDEFMEKKTDKYAIQLDDYFHNVSEVHLTFLREILDIVGEARVPLYYDFKVKEKMLLVVAQGHLSTEDQIHGLMTIAHLLKFYAYGDKKLLHDFMSAFGGVWAQNFLRIYLPIFAPANYFQERSFESFLGE